MAGTQVREIRVVDAYTVYIGNDIISNVGKEAAKAAKSRKALVVTDDNISHLYIEKVEKSLAAEGFEVIKFVFPHGERSKCVTTYVELLNCAAANRLCRSDIMIAVGGGVTGDMTGFAAATYMRGIKYIQVPTSLLAAVDSSVGGKTAIDLDIGKNLVGAFHRPAAVICDVATLATLPNEFLSDGMAEVIKYAHIREPELLKVLENSENIYQNIKNQTDCEKLIDIVARCVSLKAQIVNTDELDTGERQLLNFGHTAGHAIEAASDFGISHGHAVATGMCIFARAAAKCGFCSQEVADGIIALNRKYGLPTDTDYAADRLYNAALSDKKSVGNAITAVIPEKRALSTLKKLTHDELYEFIKAGTEK